MSPLLGVIADDFTGATDIACALTRHGMSVLQTVGIPTDTAIHDRAHRSDAVVVALKTRSCPVTDAVNASRSALEWLRRAGCRQFYFKYCSTFDSTAEGNIGPVADALLKDLDSNFAVVCPAFPANARTVYMGHLFVGDRLLSESPLKDHPVTPMRDSDVVRLMRAQTAHPVALIDFRTVSSGAVEVGAALESALRAGATYGVIDAVTDKHVESIGAAVRSHLLVTGSSALGAGLALDFQRNGLISSDSGALPRSAAGRTVILAGSCSAATRGQIRFASKAYPHFKVDARRVASGDDVVPEIMAWAKRNHDQTLMISTSDTPRDQQALRDEFGQERLSESLEATMAELARILCKDGFTRFVVAGGETSGAVVSALDVRALEIGAEIDTGVPWTVTAGKHKLALALKSGNFGGEDFFVQAVDMLQ